MNPPPPTARPPAAPPGPAHEGPPPDEEWAAAWFGMIGWGLRPFNASRQRAFVAALRDAVDSISDVR